MRFGGWIEGLLGALSFLCAAQGSCENPSVPAALGELGDHALATSPERTVACLSSGWLVYSTDGKRFVTGEHLPIPGTLKCLKGAFGDGEAGPRFVFIGHAEPGQEMPKLFWRACTVDGIRWAATEGNAAEARDIAYGAGHWVVAGPRGLIESSHDGHSWVRHRTAEDADFSRITWDGNRFTALAVTSVWTSPDGLHWSK